MTVSTGEPLSNTAGHGIPSGINADEAYITMVTSDNYVVGALVLGHSLRATGTRRPLVCMCTDGVSPSSLAALADVFDALPRVPVIDSQDRERLAILGRPELGPTLTKVNVWALQGIRKAVFLDADMLVLRAVDDLFGRPELSACADIGWPDCFNSGLFVCCPSLETFRALLRTAREHGSFDGTL